MTRNLLSKQIFQNKIVPLQCEFQLKECKLEDKFIKIPHSGFVKIDENWSLVKQLIDNKDKQIQALAKKFRYHVYLI